MEHHGDQGGLNLQVEGKDEDGAPTGLMVDETVLLDDHKYIADVIAEAHAARDTGVTDC